MDTELLVPLRSPHSPCAINLKDGWGEGGGGRVVIREIERNLSGPVKFWVDYWMY